MTNIENKKIDPVEFLALYQKMQQLNPRAFECIKGFIDGVSVGFDIAVNQQDRKGA